MTELLNIVEIDEPFPPRECVSGSNLDTATLRSGVPEYADMVGANKLNGGAVAQQSARLNRNILALDLGTKTGWAVATRGGQRFCGTESFSPRASWSPGQRWARFRAWLTRMLDEHQINVIAYEHVSFHAGVRDAHCYGAFRCLVEMAADSRNIPLANTNVQTVKLSWTALGGANKDSMVREAKRRGFNPPDDNAADALAVLNWALMEEHPSLLLGDGSLPDPKKAVRKVAVRKAKAAEPQGSLV